jgi:hypothetical protein
MVVGEIQKLLVSGIFLEVKGGRRVTLINLPPSVSRLSRKCGNLDVPQPQGTTRPATATAFIFVMNVFVVPQSGDELAGNLKHQTKENSMS